MEDDIKRGISFEFILENCETIGDLQILAKSHSVIKNQLNNST